MHGEKLSVRELEVLRLAASGMSNKEIALSLGLNIRTVKGHFADIFAKLGVSSRTEAVITGVRAGFLSLSMIPGNLTSAGCNDEGRCQKYPGRLTAKVQRNIHIWIIAIIMDSSSSCIMPISLISPDGFPGVGDIVAAHGAALLVLSFIFVIPIIYASIVYGLRGTVLTWFIFLFGRPAENDYRNAQLGRCFSGFPFFALVALLLGLLISLARSATKRGESTGA